MMDFDPNRKDCPAPPRVTRVRFAPMLGALLMLLTGLGGGYFSWHYMNASCPLTRGDAEEQGQPPADQSAGDYRKWDSPNLALILSGQMHGYIDPCGCSYPQFGGLIRRWNFVDSLRTGAPKKKGWNVVGIDLGELPHLQGIHAQNLLKYDLTLNALAAMNYRAVGIGKHEILSPLGEALAQAFDKKRPLPRPLVMPLAQTEPGELYYDLNARPYEIVADTSPKVGIISLMGPDMRDQLKAREQFLNTMQELPKALNAFANAGVEFGVILHHEYPKVAGDGLQQMLAIERKRRDNALTCAKFCADARQQNPRIPPIYLMMILSDEPEPPSVMRRLDPNLPTHVVEIGHKGKYVGLVGVYRERTGFRMQYQIVSMGPEWETKDAKIKTQPVIALMEKYNDELKGQNMLAKFPRSLHDLQRPAADEQGLKATYVGSDTCADCHQHAHNVWKGTRHAGATSTLENLKHPSGRNFDPECMMCHTVGLKHPGGYHDPVDAALWPNKPAEPFTAARRKKHNDKLRDVGCESCHGPASAHVKNPDDLAVRALINPYGPSKEERALEAKLKLDPRDEKNKLRYTQLFEPRMRAIEQSCIKCHDHENDVNWGKPGKDKVDKWIGQGIIHRTPPPKNSPDLVNPPAELKIGPGVVPPIPEIKIEVLPEKKK